jgi:hypothetical protein
MVLFMINIALRCWSSIVSLSLPNSYIFTLACVNTIMLRIIRIGSPFSFAWTTSLSCKCVLFLTGINATCQARKMEDNKEHILWCQPQMSVVCDRI